MRGPAFSPDSRWLAWSQPVAGRSLRRIRLVRIESPEQITDVTSGRFEDEQPVFTRDGRYLVFLSWRGFDPVHDVHTGDLSFPLGCRPYLVPLAADTLVARSTPRRWTAAGGSRPGPAAAGGAIRVDPQDLAERLVPFPVIASKYSSPAAGARRPGLAALADLRHARPDLRPPHRHLGSPALEYFDLATATRSTLQEQVDGYAVSGDGGALTTFLAGALKLLPLSSPHSAVTVDLRRITHTVHPAAEWRQAYREAARIVRDQFWDPALGGLDWPALTEQYAPLLERVATPDDFADLLRELLGELGTSHAYVTPSRRGEGPARGAAAARPARRLVPAGPPTGAGCCTGSCPASPPTRAPAHRWPATACATATSCSRSPGARPTRCADRPRCWPEPAAPPSNSRSAAASSARSDGSWCPR